MKFCTFFIFTLAFIGTCSSQGIKLAHSSIGKIVTISLNSEIEYYLHSDSVLGLQYLNQGKVASYTDSLIILHDESEIKISDFKRITILPKKNRKAKLWTSPFLVLGTASFLKGAIMVLGEGLKGSNSKSAPLFVGIGLAIGLPASIPHWKTKKSYAINSDTWNITVE